MPPEAKGEERPPPPTPPPPHPPPWRPRAQPPSMSLTTGLPPWRPRRPHPRCSHPPPRPPLRGTGACPGWVEVGARRPRPRLRPAARATDPAWARHQPLGVAAAARGRPPLRARAGKTGCPGAAGTGRPGRRRGGGGGGPERENDHTGACAWRGGRERGRERESVRKGRPWRARGVTLQTVAVRDADNRVPGAPHSRARVPACWPPSCSPSHPNTTQQSFHTRTDGDTKMNSTRWKAASTPSTGAYTCNKKSRGAPVAAQVRDDGGGRWSGSSQAWRGGER